MKTYQEIRKQQQDNKAKILDCNPVLRDESGIYFIFRYEDDMKFGYVGQAKKVVTRLAQHLSGVKDWIDLSIKKHGIYSLENETGYHFIAWYYDEQQLNRMERYWIKYFANRGYQLRNKTMGGQDKGKVGINENTRKGYRDGVDVGYKKAQKEVAKLFEKNLVFSINGTENKIKQKSFDKFKNFIKID